MNAPAPISRGREAWWVNDPTLAGGLAADDRVTAQRALDPWTEPRGDAARMWAAFKDSPAGQQAASSLLATDGARHLFLAKPVARALAVIPEHPRFLDGNATLSAGVAKRLMKDAQPADLAALAYVLPATATVEWFGLPLTPEDADRCAEAQTSFLWAVDITEAEQVAAMKAAWQLRQACEQAADDPLPGTVAAALAGAGLDRADVIGLLYGVSIPWIMGVKYATTNAAHVLLRGRSRGAWRTLAAIDQSTLDGRRVAQTIVQVALRSFPPVRSIFRSAKERIDLPEYLVDGEPVVIEPGDRITLDVRALNAATPDWTFGVPDRRLHFCLGAQVGRAQAAAQLGALAREAPDAELVDYDLDLIDSRFHNGPRRERIAFR